MRRKITFVRSTATIRRKEAEKRRHLKWAIDAGQTLPSRLLKNDFRPHFHAKTPMILMVVFQKHGFFNALLVFPARHREAGGGFLISC
jgi:hypothetical protein